MLEQLWLFCFFVFLVLWFLVFWFFVFFGFGFIVERVIFQETRIPQKQKNTEPKKQKNKKPKNQTTIKPKEQRTNKNKRLFQHSPWSFGFLVFVVSVVGWFFTGTFGGLKLDTPEKARTRRWERCFAGDGLSWGGGGNHILYIYIYTHLC